MKLCSKNMHDFISVSILESTVLYFLVHAVLDACFEIVSSQYSVFLFCDTW